MLYEVVKIYEVEAGNEEEAQAKVADMETLGKQWLLLRGVLVKTSSWASLFKDLPNEQVIFRR